ARPLLLAGAFLGRGLARACLLRRRLWMNALGKHLLACGAVPLLVLVLGDFALDKQLCELSALRLALERHQAEASKRNTCLPAVSIIGPHPDDRATGRSPYQSLTGGHGCRRAFYPRQSVLMLTFSPIPFLVLPIQPTV